MGISAFLTRVLDTAGRPCDLRDYGTRGVRVAGGVEPQDDDDDGKVPRQRRRRPLRIGIDAATWIYTAAHRHGEMLGDERHLTNYGRANLYQEQQEQQQRQERQEGDDPTTSLSHGSPSEETIQQYVETCTKYVVSCMECLRDTSHADILIVLDGESSPPIKQRETERRRAIRQQNERLRDQPVDPHESPTQTNALRTKAFRRAGAGRYFPRIVTSIKMALRQAPLPFMVAPYEADSQLAYLSEMGLIDLVLTEDSDLVAHGARTILYKSTVELGMYHRPCGKLLQFSDIGAVTGETFHLTDFSPVMMTILFVSVGCDYCDKLKGVGLITATRVIRDAFLTSSTTTTPPPRGTTSRHHHQKSKLTRVLEGLYTHSYLDSSTLTPQFKFDYEERFLAAIFMYRHPLIYDPLQEDNLIFSRTVVEPLEADHQEGGDNDDDNDDERVGRHIVRIDPELMDHEAYVELCGDLDRIQDIVGTIRPKEEAMRRAQGLEVVEEPSVPVVPPPPPPPQAQEENGPLEVSTLDPPYHRDDKEENSQCLATQDDHLPVAQNDSSMIEQKDDEIVVMKETAVDENLVLGEEDEEDVILETQPVA